MNKKFRLPVLALSTAVAFSGAVVVPVSAPLVFANVAFAQESSAQIPESLIFGDSEQAQKYASLYATYKQVSVAREFYAEATHKAFFPGPASRTWDGRHYARRAADVANARLAMVLLQASDFEGARAIDIEKIGFDSAVTAAAEEVSKRHSRNL